ncbi:hypothetical protein GCM10027074_67880 [Streptomyces deserti]
MRPVHLTHEFVDYIPEHIAPGVLYVSLPYATVVHQCCCGCGHRTVTPLSPSDWQLTFDGEAISLNPSIGNWSYPCQSHYWIRRNTAHWAPRWTAEKITANRTAQQRPAPEHPSLASRVLQQIHRLFKHRRSSG